MTDTPMTEHADDWTPMTEYADDWLQTNESERRKRFPAFNVFCIVFFSIKILYMWTNFSQ